MNESDYEIWVLEKLGYNQLQKNVALKFKKLTFILRSFNQIFALYGLSDTKSSFHSIITFAYA